MLIARLVMSPVINAIPSAKFDPLSGVNSPFAANIRYLRLLSPPLLTQPRSGAVVFPRVVPRRSDGQFAATLRHSTLVLASTKGDIVFFYRGPPRWEAIRAKA